MNDSDPRVKTAIPWEGPERGFYTPRSRRAEEGWEVSLMTLDLTWLRTWVEVVDVGGFARAAEQIHLSQPRVSAHIASLERELGCRLIERRVRPLTLTEEGKQLLPKARAVLAAADELVSLRLAEQGELSGL